MIPKALDVKPSILEYNGTGRNIQMMKRTAKTIPRVNCIFCRVFIAKLRFNEVKGRKYESGKQQPQGSTNRLSSLRCKGMAFFLIFAS